MTDSRREPKALVRLQRAGRARCHATDSEPADNGVIAFIDPAIPAYGCIADGQRRVHPNFERSLCPE
jgi:hypothetical protein